MQTSNHKPDHAGFSWRRHSFTGRIWPRNKIVRSFLMTVPWINLGALAILIWCVSHEVLIQPGRVMELPEATFEEGLPVHCPTAVLRRLLAPGREHCTVLLLDEGRYSSDSEAELATLADLQPGDELNLVADKNIPYGDVLIWVERLRQCGVERVNLVMIPGKE